MFIHKIVTLSTVLFVMLFVSACAVTTDSTKSSSETFQNTTDASSDLTSSTSHRDENNDHDEQVLKFVQSNYTRLRSDIAVGEGEHLKTLATLLSIDDANKDRFYAMTKNKFNHLFVSSDTTAKQFIANLHREIDLAHI